MKSLLKLSMLAIISTLATVVHKLKNSGKIPANKKATAK
jgi:hypothetical protein